MRYLIKEKIGRILVSQFYFSQYGKTRIFKCYSKNFIKKTKTIYGKSSKFLSICNDNCEIVSLYI